MARFSRKRELVDVETGEQFLSDERISVVGNAVWDRGRFVKLFLPAIDLLVGLKPSEFQLAMHVLSRLKNGSRELKLSYQAYKDWCEIRLMKAPDRSTYHKSLKALVRDGLVVKAGKEWLINHKLAFVGDRSKFLAGDLLMERL